jgi:predicted DCC family thiol-disulfide oxidoreductase YuxK
MKTLNDHTIFYDAVCPMCNLYTNAFVKTGMLDKDGREPYQTMTPEYASQIDCKRAVNEIALMNKQTGEIYYGVTSLFIIIGNAFPVFRPLFLCKPFAWMADKAYKFISYNRRVIMPSSEDVSLPHQNPSFNLRYRLAFLIVSWFITALILNCYSKLLIGLVPASNFYREFLVCGGQIFWQLGIMSLIKKDKSWDYLGTMMTISFAGGLMLLPAIVLSNFVILSPYVYAAYFMLVVSLMLLEHIRRTRLLKISWIISVSWVSYRIILLFIILR